MDQPQQKFHLILFTIPEALQTEVAEPEKVNPIALRKAKIVYNFGLSECSWDNDT